MSGRPAWGLLVWGLSPVWHTERRHHADGDVALSERAALLVRVVAALRHDDALSRARRKRVSSRPAWRRLTWGPRPAWGFARLGFEGCAAYDDEDGERGPLVDAQRLA